MKTTSNETLSRTLLTLNGRGYELTTFKGGRTELYEEYSDAPGLNQFVGYVEDVLSHLPAVVARDLQPALQAHQAAHESFWAQYLPGAPQWLHTSF